VNANYIVKDGFSDPDTERFFTSWEAERAMKAIVNNQNCGACQRCLFFADGTVQPKWLLCLHHHSPYYLETLSWAFGCPEQIPDPTVQHLVLPSPNARHFPSNDRPRQFGPRLGDEPPRSRDSATKCATEFTSADPHHPPHPDGP